MHTVIILCMVRIRMTKEERTRKFLDWYDGMLQNKGWRSEQVASRGDFDSSVITNYRAGRTGVGQKVAERAARAFGYDDEQVLRLLQDLQLVPGGEGEPTKKSQKAAESWARKIDKIDDDDERQRLIETVDTIIAQAVKRRENRAQTGGQRAPRAAGR
jgi:transcriptional regulator with XRE-family HTH domain